MITSDEKCTRAIQSGIVMATAAFSKKKAPVTSKLDVNLREKLIKCYIWSVALCGAELGDFGKWIRNNLCVLKCGAGEDQLYRPCEK